MEAGRQIRSAPSFSANRSSLKIFGLQDRVDELNNRLVELSKQVEADSDRVAGYLTTTGKGLGPEG